jgi:hypothetical protein
MLHKVIINKTSMETSHISNIFFGIGGILLMIAISYAYNIKSSPKSNRITNVFWILANTILAISLFLRYQDGHDVFTSAVMILIANFAVWKTIKKEKENIKRDT